MASFSAPSPACGTEWSEAFRKRQRSQPSLLEGTALTAVWQQGGLGFDIPLAADSRRGKVFLGPPETPQSSALQGMGLNSGKGTVPSPKSSTGEALTFTGETPQAALVGGGGLGGCRRGLWGLRGWGRVKRGKQG